MERYAWTGLNKQQLGKFAEYFVKMELTMHGFQVFGTEVDDRGIDFITRFESGPFLQVQVKSARLPAKNNPYVYMQKSKFVLHEHLFLAFALLIDREAPRLYLIPSTTWQTCVAEDTTFVSRDYGGALVSAPEYGLNVSKRSMQRLDAFSFDKTLSSLQRQTRSEGQT